MGACSTGDADAAQNFRAMQATKRKIRTLRFISTRQTLNTCWAAFGSVALTTKKLQGSRVDSANDMAGMDDDTLLKVYSVRAGQRVRRVGVYELEEWDFDCCSALCPGSGSAVWHLCGLRGILQ